MPTPFSWLSLFAFLPDNTSRSNVVCSVVELLGIARGTSTPVRLLPPRQAISNRRVVRLLAGYSPGIPSARSTPLGKNTDQAGLHKSLLSPPTFAQLCQSCHLRVSPEANSDAR